MEDQRCACGGGCPRCGGTAAPPASAAGAASPVVTFEPQQGAPGKDRPAEEAGTGTAAGGGPAAGPRCQVSRFHLRYNTWNRQWPNGSGEYELRLPVDLTLELASGVGRADCRIGQQKKGRVEYGRFRRMGNVNIPMVDRVVKTDSTWTADAPPGQAYWWDGSDWHAGQGSWRLSFGGYRDERATFKDEPGFASPSGLAGALSHGYAADGIGEQSFPIYWGGVGRKGHFMFRTYVEDAASGATVRELFWGLLIDYADPMTGRHYFF